jgi:hypothetical protein
VAGVVLLMIFFNLAGQLLTNTISWIYPGKWRNSVGGRYRYEKNEGAGVPLLLLFHLSGLMVVLHAEIHLLFNLFVLLSLSLS